MLCITERIEPGHVQWMKNGLTVVNSTAHTIGRHAINPAADAYANTLMVTGVEHQTQNITCIVTHDNDTFSEVLIIEGLGLLS